MLVESGTYDPIFPLQAVEASVRIARERVYRLWGAEADFETDIFEGRHRISGSAPTNFSSEKLINRIHKNNGTERRYFYGLLRKIIARPAG